MCSFIQLTTIPICINIIPLPSLCVFIGLISVSIGGPLLLCQETRSFELCQNNMSFEQYSKSLARCFTTFVMTPLIHSRHVDSRRFFLDIYDTLSVHEGMASFEATRTIVLIF